MIETVYRDLKALDPTRPGDRQLGLGAWVSDPYCVHDYTPRPGAVPQIFKPLALGEKAEGELAYKRESLLSASTAAAGGSPAGSGWGYGERPKGRGGVPGPQRPDRGAAPSRHVLLLSTQPTDVEQEVNGQ